MDITEKVYNFMKSSVDKNGFPPSIHQVADEFNIPDSQVRLAIEQLEKSRRIKVVDDPREAKIEFIE